MYNKSFNKVISLVAAVMLWIYVIGQINPATERKIEKIPINFINENIIDEEGLSVSRISHKYVDVVLEGKRSEINSISKDVPDPGPHHRLPGGDAQADGSSGVRNDPQ